MYYTLNVDCTGIFIMYMYAHLLNICVFIMLSFTIHSSFTLVVSLY